MCKDKARLTSLDPSDRTRGSRHKLRQRRSCFLWTSGNTFCCENDWLLPWIALGACGLTILGDTQKPSGNGPRQRAVGGPAWAVWVGQDNFQRMLQPQPQFCDAVAVLYTSDTEAILSSRSCEFSNLKAAFFQKQGNANNRNVCFSIYLFSSSVCFTYKEGLEMLKSELFWMLNAFSFGLALV